MSVQAQEDADHLTKTRTSRWEGCSNSEALSAALIHNGLATFLQPVYIYTWDPRSGGEEIAKYIAMLPAQCNAALGPTVAQHTCRLLACAHHGVRLAVDRYCAWFECGRPVRHAGVQGWVPGVGLQDAQPDRVCKRQQQQLDP